MGRAGQAITLLTPDDAGKWRQIEKALGRKLERRPWTHVASTAPARPVTSTVDLQRRTAREKAHVQKRWQSHKVRAKSANGQ
jgi:superfamily II DNA/RNA helicase